MQFSKRILTLFRRTMGSKPCITKPRFMRENERYAGFDIGDWTYGWPVVLHSNCGSNLKIGRFCCIAQDVVIMLGGEHHIERLTTYHFELMFPELGEGRNPLEGMTRGDVVIGNDVWIGHGAFIRSGVNIGDGAVIGALAVVTKDVPPFAIFAGNPGKVIHYRFPKENRELLLKLAWWDWPIEKVKLAWPYLRRSGLKELVEFAKEHGMF